MDDLSDLQQAQETSRRVFLERLGLLGGTSLMLANAPWVMASVEDGLKAPDAQKVRLAVVGMGSRGKYLLGNMLKSPSCVVVAVCDDYAPHLEEAVKKTDGKAKGFADLRAMIDWGAFDALVIATPLYLHASMTLAGFAAGKHVFCEKAMARTVADTREMIVQAQKSGRVLQIGHQRVFEPRYIEIAQQVHEGRLGTVTQIRAYWHRNGDWRRKGHPPEEERRFNWRLIREYSGGLSTELGSHQIQLANWLFQAKPERVSGSGDICYWKDGREVHDHVALVFDYPEGRKLIWDSLSNNRYYGCEEQIMGSKGTIEAELSDFYSETPPPVPGLQQMIRDVAGGVFKSIPIGGSSYGGEYKMKTPPEKIVSRLPVPKYDDGVHQFEAFAAAVRRGKNLPGLMRHAYYATVGSLMGEEAAFTRQPVLWPKIADISEEIL